MKKLTVFALIMSVFCLISKAQVSLDEYLNDPLGEVFRVASDKDLLTVSGYLPDQTSSTTKTIRLSRGEVLAVSSFKYFRPNSSLLTIPFKVRRAVDGFPHAATAGLTNVGLNFTMPEYTMDRYFSSGLKSTHKFGMGLLLAPSVEELTPATTNNLISTNSKQFFLSGALTLTYTYNNIQLALVPLGYDLATTSQGREWAYNKKPWWGFGIGIDPKIFSPMLLK